MDFPAVPESLRTTAFEVMWELYLAHRKEIRKKLTALAASRLLVRLERWGEERAIAALDYSISQGWIGVFEEKDGSRISKAYDTLKAFAARGNHDAQ